MKLFRSDMKFLCLLMAVLTLIVSTPKESVLAALIDTETIIDSSHSQKARDQLMQFIAREDIQKALIANGIDPMEAEARIYTLSDEEVIRISDQIEKLPAGGGAAEFLLIMLLILILVFVILDLSGVTDVFTFIKPQK